MRRGVSLLGLGLLLAALGAASAYAAGTTTTATTTSATTTSTTTTATTTTTSTTTTGTTTTTPPPPSYSPLPAAYLSAGCVGAGAAAIAVPGQKVLALGTPAASRGPSAYPVKAPIIRFLSSTATGSACATAHVALASVSLFGGAVTAQTIESTHGRGTVSGVRINGSPVTLSSGRSVRVGSWGEVTVEKRVGRLTAPLVVQLLAAHQSLPAGTTIALAFGASPQVVHKSKSKPHSGSGTHHTRTTDGGGSKANPKAKAKEHRSHKATVAQPLTAVPGLGYKPKHYVFPVDGGASFVDTYGANRNDVYDGWHHGDDLFAPLGTPVVAVARGTLSLVGWNELGGWRLWLTDRKGNSFYYAHLAGYARWILTEHHVRAGQVIGFLGRTGDAFTTTPHLHFEIHPHQPAFVKLGYDGAVNPTTYLQKWRVEHFPTNLIPQPARLKAPVGTPRQEAAVVWRELLVARHLVPAQPAKPATPPPTSSPSLRRQLRRQLPRLPSYDLRSASPPLRVAPVRASAAQVPGSQTDLPLLVGGPVGAVLALSSLAGAFFLRRRRRTAAPEAAAAAEPSS